jgi:nucleoside-diphosphate-sugar epimerase
MPPFITVVGADGFVGSGLAGALKAHRVVYGLARNGEVHISQAEELVRNADVVINTSGFRVRRGLTYADYQRCHQASTAAFIPWVRKGALFIHMSSAHVLGKSRDRTLGNHSEPNPTTYPSAAYALAKWEADQFLATASAEHDFRVIFLRPTILYARPGDSSLVDNLVNWAKRGIILRLYPRCARHHLCHLNLLGEVARRVIERHHQLRHLSCLVVADPYTVTSRELEAMIRQHVGQRAVTAPVPSPLMSALLRHAFHSRNPKLDLRTWGDIFGVFHLDTVYDSSETFRVLGVDQSEYSMEKTLLPLIEESLRS